MSDSVPETGPTSGEFRKTQAVPHSNSFEPNRFAARLTPGVIDMTMHLAKVYPATGEAPDDPLAVLATACRSGIGTAGAWLTARLASDRPLKHAMILGLVGTLLARRTDWYPIALAMLRSRYPVSADGCTS